MKSVAVVGWYGHSNVGDEAFKVAFKSLWPDVHFEFVDEVPKNLSDFDALVFGGGSFMDRLPTNNQPVPNIPIAFVGVGLHVTPPAHTREWLAAAKTIVLRNQPPAGVDALVAPDLVFAVDWPFPGRLTAKKILVLGNDFATPRGSHASWQSLGAFWFEQELASILDQKIKNGYTVTFYPMQASSKEFLKHDDRFWNNRIASLMEHRRLVTLKHGGNEWKLAKVIRYAELVISLRYHGCVFSTIFGTPFVGVSMHDKTRSYFVERDLKNYCDFYGFNKETFAQAAAAQPGEERLAAIREESYKQWQLTSDIVRDALDL